MKKEHLWRGGIYAVGILLQSLGAACGCNTGMGISPINSFPYAVKSAFGCSLFSAMFLFFCLMIMLQFVLKGKNRRWRDLLQLAFGLVFSFLVNLFDQWIPTPEVFWQRMVVQVAAILLMGIGITMIVNMDLIPNPAEGATAALAAALKVDLGLGKNIVDISVVTAAFLVDLLFGTLWTSIGLTTVISSIFNGRSVYLFNRLLRDRILALAGLEKEI